MDLVQHLWASFLRVGTGVLAVLEEGKEYQELEERLREGLDELGREGAPDDRICVTGIPVRPVFTRDLDRRELRPRLGSPKTSRQSCS